MTLKPHPLITPAELRSLTASERPVRILDVRWRLGEDDGRDQFDAGHIPAAVYVDMETELARHGEPSDGRHPLPSKDVLQQAIRRWGINQGDTVVVYDDWKSMSAARAWWLLRFAGFIDVRVLDGGWRGWLAAAGETETIEQQPAEGTAIADWSQLPVLDSDSAAAIAKTGVLFDARAGERYRGEVEPIDPRAGHIPGARSLPTAGLTTNDGRLLGAAELSERLIAAGATSADEVIGMYCGSGISAAHLALAATVAGYDVALYPGSWSQWSNLDRPVATGEARG
ncbi:rhodanese-like domain-containing protein [Lysinibacter cavernae]|uniref:Thiosulfate/3-mercaptopyruvate sulfurtransferase n=1 Tax=Lysinibacter cavernae TaxID=1640652 RepID=A0A7X5QZ64_9MICO|nr:thiosulfate/3-mercaptopyruvate sulfurtransferase [Lysinibacter cavernae]